jgi:SSS family solute:Na+ symporter
VKWFSFDLTDRITVSGIILMYFVMWVSMASADQLTIQRYLSTKDAVAARRSFLTNAISNSLVSTALALCGIALVGYFIQNMHLIPSVQELLRNKPALLDHALQKMSAMNAFQQKVYTLKAGADDLFPWFIAHILPAGLSGVLIAALFSAAMSSVSSGVNSITTVLMTDFPKLFVRGDLDEAKKVARAKAIGVVIGVTAIVIGLTQNAIKGNFMELAQKINGFFTAPMTALFMMAFFMKRVNRQGAWVSIFVGFIVGVVVSYFGEISKLLTGNEIKVSFMYILPFSLASSLLIAYIVSLFFPAPVAEPAQSPAAEQKVESEA